jgi:hypothetical protein
MKNKPMIIELVGPPGAGKSTLARALLKQDNRMHVETFPYFRRVRQVPFFARNLWSLLPTLLHLYHSRKDGWLTWRDIALMTILQGWHRVLERVGSSAGTVVILEEGAICLLAKLRGFGSQLLTSESARQWWQCTYRQWAETLDWVIRLDTPTSILVKRIRARDMAYEIGELTDEEAARYLAHIQAAQDDVLSVLMAMAGAPKLLCFDTVERTPEEICDQVVALGLQSEESYLQTELVSWS